MEEKKKNIFKYLENKAKERLKYFENLSEEKKHNLVKVETQISEELKLKLDKVSIEISDIQTSFRKDFKTKDGELIDVYYTIFTPSNSQKSIAIVSNLEREILYVKVSINKFLSAKEFFDSNEKF